MTREPTTSERWQARRRHPGIWIGTVGMLLAVFSNDVRTELGGFQAGLLFAGALALLVLCWRDAEREARRVAAAMAEYEEEEVARRIALPRTET